MVKRVTAYESHGLTFATKAEAEAHHNSVALADLMDDLMDEGGVCRGGEWSQETVKEWMIDAGWPLINCLTFIARRSK